MSIFTAICKYANSEEVSSEDLEKIKQFVNCQRYGDLIDDAVYIEVDEAVFDWRARNAPKIGDMSNLSFNEILVRLRDFVERGERIAADVEAEDAVILAASKLPNRIEQPTVTVPSYRVLLYWRLMGFVLSKYIECLEVNPEPLLWKYIAAFPNGIGSFTDDPPSLVARYASKLSLHLIQTAITLYQTTELFEIGLVLGAFPLVPSIKFGDFLIERSDLLIFGEVLNTRDPYRIVDAWSKHLTSTITVDHLRSALRRWCSLSDQAMQSDDVLNGLISYAMIRKDE